MAIRKIKLTVQYDGADYHGWQIQPGHRTIQGELMEALRGLTGADVAITGASRTDAGVSALGQTACFEIDSPIPTQNFAKAITDRLPEDIAVSEAVEVPRNFDVIGDVTNKMYRYSICTAAVRPVLYTRHCWHHPHPLNAEHMHEGAQFLLGKHDFKSFASAADDRESSVRTIFTCHVARAGDWIKIEAEGDGFLYNMVRNIVGTLADVGAGRTPPAKIKDILEAKDRTAAGPIAPAAGLCLMWIKYE
jgi:tRNA pseudouridine38-40 synthase